MSKLVVYTYEKWKEEVELLRTEKLYTDLKTASILEIDPGNFSRYMKGDPVPGKRLLNRFKKKLEPEIREIKEKQRLQRHKTGFEDEKEDYRMELDRQGADIKQIKTDMVELKEELRAIRALLEGQRKVKRRRHD